MKTGGLTGPHGAFLLHFIVFFPHPPISLVDRMNTIDYKFVRFQSNLFVIFSFFCHRKILKKKSTQHLCPSLSLTLRPCRCERARARECARKRAQILTELSQARKSHSLTYTRTALRPRRGGSGGALHPSQRGVPVSGGERDRERSGASARGGVGSRATL